ncbi:type I DNA topoisomerase [Clostridium estertheticum]|uniref:type I DNA topoisomerase n=1 Tax=Clostridium estertheticum TaxID=238834 RepID=UPI0013EE7FAB|nr:type I DNA topoisomerase [Clostridium estertheticum]MBZ9608295.1 type I DNA topoisomerase [Clostridium estertheticum]
MGQKLVIVESPAKAKTIKKYLGSSYVVEASMGHVRDLPKSQLGVDIENNYEPKYITIRGKGELLSKLRKEAKKSDKIYLATDPDREGEAIAWHLAKALKIDEKDKCRIEFNEITKTAVKNAIKSPRVINATLVDAQQARRILDRLVGYEISPILWRKVKWGLSAGRVQSVTLKIICDRQKEIEKFITKEYWTIECELYKEGDSQKLNVKLASKGKEKVEMNSKEESDNVINELKEKEFIISKIKKSSKARKPLPPFITSTLQQDAYRKLNFATKRTMSIAQQLYEGMEIEGHGTVGLITYMRTDSTRIAEEAQINAKEFIESKYGEQYYPSTPRIYKSKKNIQDAHEAVRPSYVEITPEIAKKTLKAPQYKLYKLIWNRYVASQMESCLLNTISIDIVNGDYVFKASGSKVSFDGFRKIYDEELDEEENTLKIPELNEGDILQCEKTEGKQHFTQPPAKFSEASLVKTLEENGIGRPSTYAPIITTLLNRKYVEKDQKTLEVTEIGNIVNDILSEYFKQIVDIEFTAQMENNLDYIEQGQEKWQNIVSEFFTPLKEDIEIAEKEIAKITIEDEVTDVECDKCGKLMVIKHGRFGDFMACPGYPECKNTKAITKELELPCPKCGGKILERRSKKGTRFFGCSNYPECDFVSWFEPTEIKCSECGTYMLKRYSKTKGDYIECSNKECKHKEYKVEENREEGSEQK